MFFQWATTEIGEFFYSESIFWWHSVYRRGTHNSSSFTTFLLTRYFRSVHQFCSLVTHLCFCKAAFFCLSALASDGRIMLIRVVNVQTKFFVCGLVETPNASLMSGAYLAGAYSTPFVGGLWSKWLLSEKVCSLGTGGRKGSLMTVINSPGSADLTKVGLIQVMVGGWLR